MSTELPIPQTRYAKSDGLSIAWQVFGSGRQDLLIVPGEWQVFRTQAA